MDWERIIMGKQILITGTGGYVGTSFGQYIMVKNGNMPQGDQWHVTFVSVRNSDWKQMDFSKYDCILHAAGIVHQKEQPGMETLYEQVNTDLTEELAKKAKEEGVGQFVFLSTMSVYGKNSGTITKETVPSPVSCYGKSKLAAEQRLQQLADEKFAVTIVRPPMIYGKNCTGNYAVLEKAAKNVPFFPKVNNKRSMIYIDNLSEFLWQAMQKKCRGIYCPQNRQFVNTSDMAARIAENYGRKMFLVPGFQWMIRLLAKRITIFTKVFGDLIYEWDLSFPKEISNYEAAGFLESIKKSRFDAKQN